MIWKYLEEYGTVEEQRTLALSSKYVYRKVSIIIYYVKEETVLYIVEPFVP